MLLMHFNKFKFTSDTGYRPRHKPAFYKEIEDIVGDFYLSDEDMDNTFGQPHMLKVGKKYCKVNTYVFCIDLKAF